MRAFPDKGGKWQISNTSGGYPMWSRGALGAGHDLFFEALDNRMMAAAYTVKGDSFVADKPRVWSDRQLGGVVNNLKNIDLAPDGKRRRHCRSVRPPGRASRPSGNPYIACRVRPAMTG